MPPWLQQPLLVPLAAVPALPTNNVLPSWLQQPPLIPLTPGGVTQTLAENLEQLTLRIGLAFLLGCIVAGVYRGTHRDEPISPSFPRTLVLLSILIAMVTQVIGDSIARAFSLTGALAIVRFRTVVRDTQDTAFVIFAVVVGMAAGADHLWVAIIGTIIVTTAILIMRPGKNAEGWSDHEYDLELRSALGTHPEDLAKPVLDRLAQNLEVRGVGTAQKGSCFELNYRLRLRPGTRPFDLISALGKLEGVQGVELSRTEEN